MDKKLIKSLKVVIALLLIQIISACSTNNLPTATLHPSNTIDINSYKYLIGSGDVLNIFVWRNP
jgi:polysaccharide export outer membrane protein